MAVAGEVVEKDCEHEGLRLENERMAREDCLIGIILDAMIDLKEATPGSEQPRGKYRC